MKRLTLFLSILLIGSTSLFAQRTHRVLGWRISRDIPVNEVKLNLPMTIFGSSPEISYERILNSDISVGASVLASFDTDRNPFQFMVTPHFRWFFGGNRESMNKYGAGFFIEANGSVYSQVVAKYSPPGGDVLDSESITGAGLGLALGWKYLSKNNWVGETFIGLGRNFVDNDYDIDQVYPRVGISIGKRF